MITVFAILVSKYADMVSNPKHIQKEPAAQAIVRLVNENENTIDIIGKLINEFYP